MSKLLRGVRRGLGKSAEAHISAEQEALQWADVFGSARHSSVGEKDGLKVAAFYRAIEIRTASMSKFPIAVRNRTARKDLPEHYLNTILRVRPNEAMSPSIYKSLVEYRRLVLGNSYVWIRRNGDGLVVELLPLPPESCYPYREPGSGKLWYIVTDPKTHQLFKLRPEEVLHYKGITRDGLLGESLLAHAAETLRVELARGKYEAAVYENGGHPSGVLTTDSDLSRANIKDAQGNVVQSATDMVRREWERIHSGPDNAFRVAVLDQGLKYQPIAMSNAEAQFVESKAVTVEDIARFTGVPLNMLFAGKQSYESNEANSLEYVKGTIHPTVVQYEEEDSFKLLTEKERRAGLWLPRNMMAELRGDSASRADWYRTMTEIGAYCLNDVLALEDMPDVEGGDIHKMSLNYVPLSMFEELSLARNLQGGKEPDDGE